MFMQVNRTYQGGTILVTEVPAVVGQLMATKEAEALIDLYVRHLDENQILGDIEVSFHEVQNKFRT